MIYAKVSYTLGQTKAHINSTRVDNSDKASAILANIWRRTASEIRISRNRNVNELVEVIKQKSEYWSDPQTYDKELFDNYNMRITQVQETLNKLCE